MLPSRLHRLRRRAQLTLWWERAYAVAIPIAVALIAWASVSLVNGWNLIPPWAHLVANIGLIGAGLGGAFFVARHLPPSPPRGAIGRIETDSQLSAGLVQGLADRPASGSEENPLWARHREQLAEQAASAKVTRPVPLVERIDPYKTRFVAGAALILCLVIAGSQIPTRLAKGLSPDFGRNSPFVADIWITPPEYTGRPPTFVMRGTSFTGGTFDAIEAPMGSRLEAKISRSDGRQVALTAQLATATRRPESLPTAEGAVASLAVDLSENAAVELRAGRHKAILPVRIVADNAPTIQWQADPETEGGNRTILSLNIVDDYGVADAELKLFLSRNVLRSPDAPKPEKRTLSDKINIPALKGPPGKRTLDLDLTDHPWAGLPVEISVRIIDGAGNVAETSRAEYELPVRVFYNPLARAVVEQRQSLALAPKQWQRSARMFDALTFAPDQFARSGREYLLIRTAYHQVANRAATASEDVVDSLWPLAMSLEDENLTAARQRLEAAQAALRDALARGASQSEIDALIEDLRIAMAEYMAALAASDNAPTTNQQADVDSMDLQDILDEIAELRRNGDTEAARKRLAELEELLRNLQISTGSQGGGGQAGGSGAAGGSQGEGGDEGEGSGEGLSGVGNLIQRQRELSDETFSARRQDRSADGLADEQRALADDADDLRNRATEEQMSEDADAAFDRAEQAMEAAANALDQGDLGLAQAFQEEAIDALRDGGQAMAAAAREAEEGEDGSDGQSANENGQTARDGRGPGESRDPLGRPVGPTGTTGLEIPDMSDPERIRELTEQLRLRLSDPALSPEERQYIERLLERF